MFDIIQGLNMSPLAVNILDPDRNSKIDHFHILKKTLPL